MKETETIARSFAQRASPELLLLALVLALFGFVLWRLSGTVGELAGEVKATRALLETVVSHVDGWR